MEHPDAFVLTADTSGPLKTPGMDSHQVRRGPCATCFARLRLPTAFLKEAGCPLKGEQMEGEEIKEEDADPLADDEEERGPHPGDPEENFDCSIPFPSDGEEDREFAYGYPGDVLVYGCDHEGQWITQLFVATMVQAFPDSRFATVDLQDQYDGGTLVRRTTVCGEQVYVLPSVMPEEGGHIWVEVCDGDYVVGEIVHRTDLEGQVHVGCVHQLRRGVPFAYDPRRWHCVTEWRKRRAVLVASSSGSLNQEDRKKLEAAGFPIFSMEEGYHPQVSMMRLVPEETGEMHEGVQDSWNPSQAEDTGNVVEPFFEEADGVVNLKFGERMALEKGGLRGEDGHVQLAGTALDPNVGMFKAEVSHTTA